MPASRTLPTDYQSYIHLSRYARWDAEKGRRETWEETVGRYVSFFKKRTAGIAGMAGFDWTLISDSILDLQVMPSMRCMMTAGLALELDNVAGFNCSYVAIDDIRAFDETLYVLMCGTGVGFSVERQFINKLPAVPERLVESGRVIEVDDSKIGWATAFQQLLAALWAGELPRWDVSAVRPAGAPLKIFGGRASGPQPLVDLFNFSVNLLRNATGRKLTSIECHDLVCKVADIVVVGGVRRSALISLSNLSDDRMRHAKSGAWWETTGHRALANNSVAYTEKPEVGAFMREWISLYESHSGERGIFNREAAKLQAARNGRRNVDHDFGVNPCCVTGDTVVLTKEGHRPIVDLIGRNVKIWNGTQWSDVVPFETGKHEIFRVSLSDGTYLDCTGNHKFAVHNAGVRYDMVQANELSVDDKLAKFEMPVVHVGDEYEIDAYSQGFYSGDGTTGSKGSFVYEPKFPCIPRLNGRTGEQIQYSGSCPRKRWVHGPMYDKNFVPVDGSSSYCLNWLAGILDSDGTVTRDKNGNGLQIGSCEFEFLSGIRLMLTRLGVRAKVVAGAAEGWRSMPNGHGGHGEVYCRAVFRLLIGNTDTHRLVQLGLKTNRLKLHGNAPQRDARQFVRVVSVESLGHEAETYCFDEPIAHLGTFNGIVTGQSEIILRSKQFCNLTEGVIRTRDDEASLARKVRIAAIMGTLQATLTDFRYLSPEWKKNTEEEALLGVSLTGIMDNSFMNDLSSTELPVMLERLKRVVVDTNAEFAAKLGINQAAATTCVKPSGTVSALVDSGSGIHSRHSQFFLRTVRADKKDPMSHLMRDAGFYVEDDVTKPANTDVFYFPIESPEGAVTRNNRTAIEQLELWKIYQLHWCEHKPSITVYVRESEWPEVGAWVYKNFDMVSGVSFLPHNESDSVYKQAPYQEVTAATFEEWKAKMPTSVDWSLIGKYEGGRDQTTNTRDLACVAGICEI